MIKYFSKISRLKRKAARQYRLLNTIGNRYDCGHELAKQVSPTYSTACQDMNAILDELSRLDPANAPTQRF